MVTATPGGWGQFKLGLSLSFLPFWSILFFWDRGKHREKLRRERETQNLGLADLNQEIVLECSWCVWRVIKRMDLRQKDKEKAKEKEKEVAPGDRTPKVRGVAKSNRTRLRMMAV